MGVKENKEEVKMKRADVFSKDVEEIVSLVLSAITDLDEMPETLEISKDVISFLVEKDVNVTKGLVASAIVFEYLLNEFLKSYDESEEDDNE